MSIDPLSLAAGLSTPINGPLHPIYPHGQIDEEDEGETEIGVAADPAFKVVRVMFRKPIEWFAMTPDGARTLAMSLIRAANELDRLKMTVILK